MKKRAVSERLKYLLSDANSFNNLLSSSAQIAVVSVGAILVIEGTINPGALIASMILNGKTLQPVMQIAGLLQKFSVAKVAYKNSIKPSVLSPMKSAVGKTFQ